MTLETWWLYLGAVVLIACTPGPNVLYVTTRSIRFGLGPAFVGMAGCLVALVMMLTGSAAGLSAVLLAVPAAFDVLKYAGAAFFPQFITPSAPAGPQFAVLVATFVAVELFFYVAYALGGRRLAVHLLRGVWRRRFNRASGVIFMGFGAVLLHYRP